MNEKEQDRKGLVMATDDIMQYEPETFEDAKAKARERYKSDDLVSLAKELVRLQAAKERLEKITSELNAVIDVIRIEIIPNAMDDAGIRTMNITGLGRLGLTEDLYMKTGDRDALTYWLHENGLQDIITETVNSSTLKSVIKSRIKAGKEIPPPVCVEITPFTRASVTKA